MSGIEGWIASGVADKIPTLKGLVNLGKMTSGLKPLFRIETCKDIKHINSRIGDRVLFNNFPDWVKFADMDPDSSNLISHSIKRVKEWLSTHTSPQLLGVLVDESFYNAYHFWANLIFQDIIRQAPHGNEWISGSFIEMGYPLRVYFGFEDQYGNVILHQYEGPIAVTDIVTPDFTGFITASTKETLHSIGDRFQITCVGFEYLLRKTSIDTVYGSPFSFAAGTPLREILGQMLIKLAQGNSTSKVGTPAIPASFAYAMGVLGKKGTVLSQSTVERNIKLIDIKKTPVIPTPISLPIDLSGKAAKTGAASLLDMIKYLSYQCNVEIYFNHYGRLTIHGRDFSTIDIAYNLTPNPKNNDKRIRLHDAVIGSNVIHAIFHTELDHTNVFDVFYYPYNSSAAKPVMCKATTIKEMSEESLKYWNYFQDQDWGHGRKFLIRQEGDPTTSYTDPQKKFAGMSDITERYKYFGMRGAVYMIGIPKARIGDLIRISDIRTKDGFGANTDVIIDLSKSAQEMVKKAINDTFASAGIKTKRKYITPDIKYLGLKGIEDIYYIWKVRHYMGIEGWDTKLFFVIEPQTNIPQGEIMLAHKQFRKNKGINGAGPADLDL